MSRRAAVLLVALAVGASLALSTAIIRPCWLEHRARGFSAWTALVACW